MKIIATVLVIFLLFGCLTTDDALPILGKYKDDVTGEYIEFINENMFVYDIHADVHPTQSAKKPPYSGTYEMTKKGRVTLTPLPAHLGMFRISFTEDRSKAIITHRISGRTGNFVRVEN